MTRPPEPSEQAHQELVDQAENRVGQLDDEQRDRVLYRLCRKYPSMISTVIDEFEQNEWRYLQ